MTPDLIVYMLPHWHTALSHALYGPAHGSGERTLDLEMVSGQIDLDLRIPVLCYYEKDMPALVTTKVIKDEWELLCNVVERRGTVKAILYDRGGQKDYLAKLGVPGGKKPSDAGGGVPMVEVRFWWKENNEVIRTLERG